MDQDPSLVECLFFILLWFHSLLPSKTSCRIFSEVKAVDAGSRIQLTFSATVDGTHCLNCQFIITSVICYYFLIPLQDLALGKADETWALDNQFFDHHNSLSHGCRAYI